MDFDAISFILIFIRISTFFIISKVVFPKGSSNWLKMGFSLILAYSLSPYVDTYEIGDNFNNMTFIFAIINEILSGLLISFITNFIFDILEIIGSWFDINIGLSMSAIYDPNTGTSQSINSKLLHYCGMTVFFICNGHHVLIKSFVHSFVTVPIGQSPIYNESLLNAIEVIVNYFSIAIKIAFPIVLIILLTDLCLGFISRAVPEINVMIIGLPVKILVGLVVISFAIPIIMRVFMNIANQLPSIIDSLYVSLLTITSKGGLVLCFALGGDDKTEEATPHKKHEERKKGKVAKSKEVSSAFTMVGTILSVMVTSGLIIKIFSQNIIHYLGNASQIEINEIAIKSINLSSTLNCIGAAFLIVIPIMILGVIGNLVQTGILFSKEPLKIKFSKINPISGFKNMFSKKTVVDLFKNLAITTIIGYIGYKYLLENYPKILEMTNLSIQSMGLQVKDLILGILVSVCTVLVIIAAIDYFLQYKFYKKDLMMTKQEVRDENKDIEGNPLIKSKIRQKQREMAQRRMMAAVPEATVIITNPTHYAVAIKYDENGLSAPKVVAKGVDNVAMKIKEIAKEHNVPIVENRPLARLLYAKIDIDSEITEEMYQAVAEVLAMLYKMNNQKFK